MNKYANIMFIILIIILLSMTCFTIYPYFEPKLLTNLKYDKLVKDENTASILLECTDKYYNAVIHNQLFTVNEMEHNLVKTDQNTLDKIVEKYGDITNYELFVNNLYDLGNNIYSCSVDVVKESKSERYDFSNVNSFKVLIKVNTKNSTFKILDSEFSI